MSETKTAAWTPEEEALIAKYVERGQTRSNAVQSMRMEVAKAKKGLAPVSPAKAKAFVHKAAAAAIKEIKAKAVATRPKADKPTISRGDAKHYDQQAVIDGFLKHGKTISELADAQKMSHVYCHRILTTKVPKEYKVEQARRVAAREKETG